MIEEKQRNEGLLGAIFFDGGSGETTLSYGNLANRLGEVRSLDFSGSEDSGSVIKVE